MKITEVVAALIWQNGRFLICQRPENKARALLWEFVGGKIEPGESGEEADKDKTDKKDKEDKEDKEDREVEGKRGEDR